MAKRFKFKFESVLKVRQAHENLRMKDFAAAQMRWQEKNEHVMKLLSERERGKDELLQMTRNSLDIIAVRLQKQYLIGLGRRIQQEQQVLAGLTQAMETERLKLVKATQDRKIMEKLKQRYRQKYDREMDRAEQKQLDEIGVRSMPLEEEGA